MKKLLILCAMGWLFMAQGCYKKGCTNTKAINFDQNAQKDDGSCYYGRAKLNLDFALMGHYGTIDYTNTGRMAYSSQHALNFSVDEFEAIIHAIRFYPDTNYINDSPDNVPYQTEMVEIEVNHYFNVNLPRTYTLALDSGYVPLGQYESMELVFGLPESINKAGLFSSTEAEDMAWPDSLGGGYHFMRVQGNYLNDQGASFPYSVHYGSTNLVNGNRLNLVTNISSGSNYLNVYGDPIEVRIDFQLESMFSLPNYTLISQWGPEDMQNSTMLTQLKENMESGLGVVIEQDYK